jgi:hypothetical protein
MRKNLTNYTAAKKPTNNRLRDEIFAMTKTHPRNEREILELRAFPRAFAKFMGSNDGALFLRQLIYWTDRPKKNRDGFFYKSVREWCEELDITEYQVEKFRAFLKDKGILEMAMRRVRKNFKEQWHYRLNQERFKEVYKNFLDDKFVFPHEDENFDYEEVIDDITEDLEAEEVAEEEETDNQLQESVTCGQETIAENEETVTSIQDIFSLFRENNNSVLDNKLTNKLHNEPSSEPHNSRNTAPPAKNSRTVYGDVSDCEVTDRGTGGNSSDARRALDVFRSVGVRKFDVTAKNDSDKRDVIFRERMELDSKLEQSIEWCERNNRSFILRPRDAKLIQIDDCNAETLKDLLPFCFFAEETSEDNFQAWLALPLLTREDELWEVRQRLLNKIDSGNGGAFGATRWVGSINFKPNRNHFRVRLIHAANGRITTAKELDEAGLLAEPEKPIAQPIEQQSETKGFTGSPPDYDRCLRDNEYDRSDADASFMAICKKRGYSRDESIDLLLDVSKRAQESHPSYIERTADFVFGKEKGEF